MHPCPLCGKVVCGSSSMHPDCHRAYLSGKRREVSENPGNGEWQGGLRWLEDDTYESPRVNYASALRRGLRELTE